MGIYCGICAEKFGFELDYQCKNQCYADGFCKFCFDKLKLGKHLLSNKSILDLFEKIDAKDLSIEFIDKLKEEITKNVNENKLKPCCPNCKTEIYDVVNTSFSFPTFSFPTFGGMVRDS